MGLKMGCIADDFTGATDLANSLVKAGTRVLQTIGVPEGAAAMADVGAIVGALKLRTSHWLPIGQPQSRLPRATADGRDYPFLVVDNSRPSNWSELNGRSSKRRTHHPGPKRR